MLTDCIIWYIMPIDIFYLALQHTMDLKQRAFKEFELNEDTSASPDELIKSHLRLVYSKATRYISYPNYDDIVSSGIEELCKLANQFDSSRGVSFAKYCAVQIEHAMLREHNNHKYGFRVENLSKDTRKVFYAHGKYVEKFGRITAIKELAKDLDVSETVARNAVDMCDVGQYCSLPDNFDIASEADTPFDDRVREEYTNLIKNVLQSSLTILTDREQLVLEKRYLTDNPVDLKTIGQELNVSFQRVQQIEKSSLIKLRKQLSQYQDLISEI